MRQEMGRDNTCFAHMTLVPWIAAAQELKTKPTQHSVKEMLSIGIQPDILLCRADRAVPREMRAKIAAFCQRRREGRHHRPRRAQHLRGAAQPRRAGRRLARPQTSSPRSQRGRSQRSGATSYTEPTTRRTRSRSPSSASTSNTKTATSRSRKRSSTAPSRTT